MNTELLKNKIDKYFQTTPAIDIAMEVESLGYELELIDSGIEGCVQVISVERISSFGLHPFKTTDTNGDDCYLAEAA